jgi:hypothetical protein
MLELVTAPPDDDRARPGNPVEHVVDIFVFAPLGLALEARSLWPQLARRGRRAIAGGRDWAGDQIERVQGHTSAALDGLGLGAGSNGTASPPQAEPPSRLHATSAPAPKSAAPSAPAPEERQSIPVVDVVTLAIPDYDSLSASQVVPRLAGLAPDELEQVRLYEAGNRGRKTILSRIAQLQAG